MGAAGKDDKSYLHYERIQIASFWFPCKIKNFFVLQINSTYLSNVRILHFILINFI